MKKLTLSTLLSVSILGIVSHAFAMTPEAMERACEGIKNGLFQTGRAVQKAPQSHLNDEQYQTLAARADELRAEIRQIEATWSDTKEMTILQKEQRTSALWDQLETLREEQAARALAVQQQVVVTPVLSGEQRELAEKSLACNVVTVASLMIQEAGQLPRCGINLNQRNRYNEIGYTVQVLEGSVRTLDGEIHNPAVLTLSDIGRGTLKFQQDTETLTFHFGNVEAKFLITHTGLATDGTPRDMRGQYKADDTASWFLYNHYGRRTYPDAITCTIKKALTEKKSVGAAAAAESDEVAPAAVRKPE